MWVLLYIHTICGQGVLSENQVGLRKTLKHTYIGHIGVKHVAASCHPWLTGQS